MKAIAPTRKGFFAVALVTFIAIFVCLFFFSATQVKAQLLPLTELAARNRSAFDVRTVSLDGYRLFQVTAPRMDNKDKESVLLPVDMRIEEIENRLYAIVETDFDPITLQVYPKVLNNQPAIYVKDGKNLTEQMLMTVTALDAQLVAGNATTRATGLSLIIKQALSRAKQERQFPFWQQQIAIAAGIMLLATALNWGTNRLYRRTRVQRANLKATAPISDTVIDDTAAPKRLTTTLANVQRRMNRQQRLNLNELQGWLIRCGQIAVWGGAIAAIAGLFPYTRWLQPFILSTPLKVFGVAILTYVGVRLVTVSIDRFFCALQHDEFIEFHASQRLALRISTLSRVLKSITVTLGAIAATTIALIVLGVDLVPLVAAAGIFAVSVSLACQHVIRDLVNGLLILIEDQYAVGDVIVVGDKGGLVEYMNLRITQLRNDEGRLISIPHGTISVVENLSKEWSRVDFTVDIAYDTDLVHALATIKAVAEQMYNEPTWRRQILELPEVLGVDEIDHAGILIRVWLKVKPLEQWNVAREFRHRLKLAFDKEGIRIGAPQQSLWFRSSLDLTRMRNGAIGTTSTQLVEE